MHMIIKLHEGPPLLPFLPMCDGGFGKGAKVDGELVLQER